MVGTPIEVAIEIDGGRARIDFSGTGDVHAGNLNATPAIVTSAVLYVLRLLVAEPIPLNEGLLEPIEHLDRSVEGVHVDVGKPAGAHGGSPGAGRTNGGLVRRAE